eukprot:6476590-Amphidinium_carterae.1
MLQPFFLKPRGELVQYVVIEVEVQPTGRRLAGGTCEPAVPISRAKKPEWQIVVGKRASKGHCAEHSAKTKRFPLTCAKRFSSLDCEKDVDDEEFHSASSDVEAPSAGSCEVSAADSVEAKQLSSKGEAFLVHKNSFRCAGQTVSAGVMLDNTSAAFVQVGTSSYLFSG